MIGARPRCNRALCSIASPRRVIHRLSVAIKTATKVVTASATAAVAASRRPRRRSDDRMRPPRPGFRTCRPVRGAHGPRRHCAFCCLCSRLPLFSGARISNSSSPASRTPSTNTVRVSYDPSTVACAALNYALIRQSRSISAYLMRRRR